VEPVFCVLRPAFYRQSPAVQRFEAAERLVVCSPSDAAVA